MTARATSRPAALPAVPVLAAAPLRVLFVEDDAEDCEREIRALERGGLACTARRVENEAGLLRAIESERRIDLVVSDYDLPTFSGPRALELLQRAGIDVPFIIVSGALGEEAAIELLKRGASDHVLKSRLDRLPLVVRRALRDADERRQRTRAEIALRASEERYRTLVHSAPDVILTIGPDDCFRSLNPAFESVLGLPCSEWTGRSIAGLVHPDDMPVALAALVRARRHDEVRSEIVRVRHASGGWRTAEVRLSGQTDDGGLVLAIARDITARAHAEARARALVANGNDLSRLGDLREALQRISARIAQAAPCEIVIIVGDEAAAAARELLAQHGLPAAADAAALGLAAGDPLDRALRAGRTTVLAAEPGATAAPLLQATGGAAAVVAPLHWHGRHFGALALVARDGQPFDDEQIAFCHANAQQIGAALDAADSRRTEREEAEVAAALARVGRELIAWTDLPMLLRTLCRVTAETLGTDVSGTLLRNDAGGFQLVAMHGEPPERWETLRAVQLPADMISALLARSGHDDLVVVHRGEHADLIPPELSALYDQSASLIVSVRRGTRVIGLLGAGHRRPGARFTPRDERIARGIAQMAALAIENARLVGQLEEASRLKSDFLATMSHELRTPLNVIIGYTELLLDEVFGTLAPEQTASLDRVGTSARELLELISATLDISRLETGRAALSLEDLDPAALLRGIEEETAALRDKPGVVTTWIVPDDLPPLHSDAVKLKVVLKNLIANAFKFTEAGSVTIRAAAADGWLALSVADTGIGMSAETQAVIFEPFRQGDSSTTRRHGGVGLGLYIVTRLLDLLGGRIEVDSTPGAGSTFHVRVPLDTLRRR